MAGVRNGWSYICTPNTHPCFVGYTNAEVHVFLGLILHTVDKTGKDERLLLAVKWWWEEVTQRCLWL
jgi:hypothetical protein